MLHQQIIIKKNTVSNIEQSETMNRLLIGTLAGIIIIVILAVLLPKLGILFGGLIGGLVAGNIARGTGRGTLAGLLAGLLAILIIAILAYVNFVIVDNVTTETLQDTVGLIGQPAYVIAIEAASIGTILAVVGGYIGGFFSQLS